MQTAIKNDIHCLQSLEGGTSAGGWGGGEGGTLISFEACSQFNHQLVYKAKLTGKTSRPLRAELHPGRGEARGEVQRSPALINNSAGIRRGCFRALGELALPAAPTPP